MSTAARIDELRKKFEENPRRYFAPLANELRKAGDLAQAIALCREHLPKQPGHMSGYIVYGQALYESGTLDEARTVFEQALTLDPENLIALRHLGDIAKASGDTSSARRWYERVLDADPRNDDIASQLVALSAVHMPTPATPTPAINVAYSPTPMQSIPAIGLPAVPTPDAALRAVDFDVVNARIAHYTPIDLDAIESAGTAAAPPTPFTPTPARGHDAWSDTRPAENASRTDALSEHIESARDAVAPRTPTPAYIDASRDVHDALGAFAAHDPSEEMRATDEFTYAAPPTPREVAAIDAVDEDLIDLSFGDSMASNPSAASEFEGEDLSEGDALAFEEGIMAPEWPDTSELLSRVTTPRFVTPTTVASTPDAVAAFGREAGDPPQERLDEVEPADDALLATSEITGTPWNGTPAIEASAIVASAVEEPEAVRFTGPFAGWDDEPESPEIEAASNETELPWLAANSADEQSEEAARAIDEIADAFADDARAVGDDPEVFVSAVELDAAAGAAVSFADVLELNDESPDDAESVSDVTVDVTSELDADEVRAEHAVEEKVEYEIEDEVEEEVIDEEVASEAQSSSPAFVTETMAELLVSQGFTARAVTVYEELVRRQPYDPVLTSRLAELQARLAEESAEQGSSTPTPATPTPAFPTPAYPTPAFSTPAFITPAFSSAAIPTPVSSTPAYPTPAFPTPAYPTPAFPTPAYPTPAFPTPAFTSPAYPTPDHATPAFSSAAFATPAYAVPASSFGASSGGVAAPMTARERFALLAARRVPRRTPHQPAAIVEAQTEGLSVLFGDEEQSAVQDDAAARALADAFAPMSEDDASPSGFLDFMDVEGDTAAGADADGVEAPHTDGVASSESVDEPNAGFSFDRFFPDPASSAQPVAEAASDDTLQSPPDPKAPVGDDLAQFSAWLKGLGSK